jgi:hypothetical protein
MLLDGQPGGGPEQPRVPVGPSAVGPPLGHRVQHLHSGVMGGGDQAGDVAEGAGGARRRGEFRQRAVLADDALLAFDGEEHRGGRLELLQKLMEG